jgi:hypothetical protein
MPDGSGVPVDAASVGVGDVPPGPDEIEPACEPLSVGAPVTSPRLRLFFGTVATPGLRCGELEIVGVELGVGAGVPVEATRGSVPPPLVTLLTFPLFPVLPRSKSIFTTGDAPLSPPPLPLPGIPPNP